MTQPPPEGTRRRILIMGAAGRDFHNFNTVFRDDPAVHVVAFTATQIPYISGRRYPASLAGPMYPKGIPIVDEIELPDLAREEHVDEVVFAYSDVTHEHVMHWASIALATGADFRLLGPRATQLEPLVPVVAVCAVRTGAGKSQTTRRVLQVLREADKRAVAVRHPMPYGDLDAQRCQRFAELDDLDVAHVSIEEREEYEPLIRAGHIVYAGVDYAEILAKAEPEADVIVWDGGNNDLPFFMPTVHIVVADPLRAGHERRYHPGETNVRMADAIVINKVDSATPEQVVEVEASVRELNPKAQIVKARSPITVEEGVAALKGKRVLVVEDGPTLTHGDMKYGAGVLAAKKAGVAEIIDPRPFAVGSIRETFENYPNVGELLPAMGYNDIQRAELAKTINASGADAVLIATPIDLRSVIDIQVPAYRVTYELEEVGSPTIADVLKPVIG